MEGCRRAERTDLPLVVEMARALREEIEPLRGSAVWQGREARAEPLEESYAALLDRPDALVLVGTIDQVPLGFAVGEVESLHDGRHLGVVSDLYVHPEARTVGVGEALTMALLEFFGEHGCVGVDAWALPGSRHTKNFFEEHGFVSRLIVVHRRLGEEPS
jgi:ribosomal protein S18 acetylase RimI-like enzyme